MHDVTNVCMKHIYKVIYDLSVYLVTFDFGLPLNVKSRSHPFNGLCLINGASYDQSLCEIHIVSHIGPCSLSYNILPLMTLKGQIKIIGFSAGYIS